MMEQTETKRKNTVLWVLFALLVIVAAVVTLINFGVIKLGGEKQDPESSLPAIKVIVANGCGYENLATDYSNYIGDQNIDVVQLRDMPNPIYDKSIIVMQIEDEQDLMRLKKMTGIQHHTVAIKEDADAQFIIILGRDISTIEKDKGGKFGR
jgi:hypothetical protein